MCSSIHTCSFLYWLYTTNYTRTKYTVTFNNNGHGTTPPNLTDVIHGSTITAPTALTESGFNFIGWYKDAELNTPWDFSKDKVTSNITLYAKWTSWDKVENVTFDKQGEVDFNDKVTLRCATTDATIYYSFDNENYKTCKPGSTVNITSNTLTAYATKEGMTTSDITTASYTFKKYTVTFNTNGHGTNTTKPNLIKGTTLSKPDNLSEEGFIFLGWFNGNDKIISDIIVETSDITITAKWCKIGDIILNDGNFITPQEQNITDEIKKKAVAIVCGVNSQGKLLGLGLKEAKKLMWAKTDTTGYNTIFTDIVCKPSEFNSDGNADRATFEGDTDGSNNWDAICKVDLEGTKDAATNYPAFNWVNNYSSNLPADCKEDYKVGWYMPSIYELTEYIYKNKDVINKALKAITSEYATPLTISSSYAYWSSSQVGSNTSTPIHLSWQLTFSDGWLFPHNKNKENKVRCIRVFD